MSLKRATFYTYNNDSVCNEIKKYIEEAGVVLNIRDLGKKPFSSDELSKLMGHINLDHFLNKMSSSYSKIISDDGVLDRKNVIELILEDPTLLKLPIVQSTRLMTIGCDKRKIAVMLQLSFTEKSKSDDELKGNLKFKKTNGKDKSESTPTVSTVGK